MRFFDLFKRSPRQPEPDVQQLVAEEEAAARAVNALALEDAEREAGTYLEDARRFRTEAGTGEVTEEDAYGPELRRFFGRYRRVVSQRSEVELEAGESVRSEADPTLSVIGFYWEHTEVDVVTGSDEIVVLATDADPPERSFRFPTVHHFICFLGRTEKP